MWVRGNVGGQTSVGGAAERVLTDNSLGSGNVGVFPVRSSAGGAVDTIGGLSRIGASDGAIKTIVRKGSYAQ